MKCPFQRRYESILLTGRVSSFAQARAREGPMFRSMVGLLAAAGAAMSALVAFNHGDSVLIMILGAASTTGLAAYLAAPPSKKIL